MGNSLIIILYCFLKNFFDWSFFCQKKKKASETSPIFSKQHVLETNFEKTTFFKEKTYVYYFQKIEFASEPGLRFDICSF